MLNSVICNHCSQNINIKISFIHIACSTSLHVLHNVNIPILLNTMLSYHNVDAMGGNARALKPNMRESRACAMRILYIRTRIAYTSLSLHACVKRTCANNDLRLRLWQLLHVNSLLKAIGTHLIHICTIVDVLRLIVTS